MPTSLDVAEHAVAGISGGRTSARMAYILHPKTVLCFQNTGREHPKTLEFLNRLENDLGREIIRLEFRGPPRGDAPKLSTFERVTHEQLSRNSEPFLDLLECLRTFRKQVKGLGPVSPWARSRICTAYLKIRVQEKYCRSLGWEDWTTFVGLRADEPDRVAKLRKHNQDRDDDHRTPLYDLGETKADILRFWSEKPFDLELPEHLGNCDACFLKDERDLADALVEQETDVDFWIEAEKTYGPMRRGRPSYAQVLAEAPERFKIRAALAAGREPVSGLPPRRHRLITLQEQQPRSTWSCSCEGAQNMSDEDLLQEDSNAL